METLKKPVIKMNTPGVNQLHLIARLMDELTRELHKVELLDGDIVDKRKFENCRDTARKATASVAKVRDAVAAKGGSQIAKGYK